MPQSTSCPHCQRRLLVEDAHLGREVRCPACTGVFTYHAPPAPPSAPPPVSTPAPAAGPILDALPADRPRTSAFVALGLAVGLGGYLVLGAVVLAWVIYRQAQPPFGPRRVATVADEGERRREIREAFRQAGPAPADPAEGMNTLFRDLGAALAGGDARAVVGHFDVDRQFDELIAQDALPRMLLRDRFGFANGVRSGLGQVLVQNRDFRWTSSQIKNVKDLAGGDAVVIVRHKTPAGVSMKMRWWLTRRGGDWKVYDLEDLDIGIRFTTNVGALLAGANNFDAATLARLQTQARAGNAVREALAALGQQDPDTAENKLRPINRIPLPPRLDAVRLTLQGLIRLQRSQFKEALALFDQASKKHADMPCLDFLRGVGLFGLGQWEKALGHFEAYRDLLGEDAIICRHIGDALRELQRFPEACVAYRKALDDNPKDADAFLGLLFALAHDAPRDDVPARFARLDKHHENFVNFAEGCAVNRDAVGIEQIAQAMRKIDPGFAAVDYYLALARVWTNKADEAVPLFQAALSREKDAQKRKDYLSGFLKAAGQAGKATLAYTAAPDSREAFRLLAPDLRATHRALDLKALVAAHAKKHPDDPLLPLYRAEVYLQEGNYHLAEKAFAAALASRPDQEMLASFRASRVLARYHTGQAMSAYREIGPREESFAQLAQLLLSDGEDGRLSELLDAHGKNNPDSGELLWYRCRLQARRGQAPEAMALFRSVLARPRSDDQRERITDEFLSDMAEAGKALEAYRAVANPRQAFQTIAEQLLEDDRSEDLRRLIDAHREGNGDDPWLFRYTGVLHRMGSAWDKAAEAFATAWKKAGPQEREHFRPEYVEALYRAGKLHRAYAEVGPRQERFGQLALLLSQDRKGAELLRLVAAEQSRGGDGPEVLFHEARAWFLMKQPDRALRPFQKAYLMQTQPFVRQHYLRQFVEWMADAGRAREAYRLAPEQRVAFGVLASRLLREKRAGELVWLLEAHGEHHPDDPQRLQYAGELCLLRRDARQAEQYLAAAFKAGRPRTDWMLRNALYRARVQAGKAVATYEEFGRDRQAFETVADVCIGAGDARQLEALIAAHRQAEPDDGNLPGWGIELLWLKKDYEGVIKALTERRATVAGLARFRWKIDGYLVRSLVRLNKADEAVRQAKARASGRRGDPLLVVLALAAAGDVKGVTAAVAAEQHRARSFLVDRCYQDEDLGPLLRGEAFATFRARFPEPKPAEGR